MTEITIRVYHPTDLRPCRVLWVELTQRHREIYDDPSIGGDDPGLHFDEHLARVGPERLWVAERAGKVVGLAGLIVDGQGAEVEPMVVASVYRREGIGQALLECVIEEAKKLEMRFLSVKPVARNLEAISFFYRVGFQTLGHIEMFADLRAAAPDTWKAGPNLFDHAFKY